jgi:hypothetical protein
VSRRPPSRLRWFTLGASEDGEDAPWSVYLCEEVRSHDGVPLVGLTLYETREIRLAAWESHAEIVHTLMHELMHASAAYHDDEIHRLSEEKFILSAEKQLWAFMVQMGARLPDLPRGFDALRRRALARREGDE